MAYKDDNNDIDVQDLIDEWRLNKEWVDSYTRDFPDLDNLADGVPLTRVKNAPVVGDVVLASTIREIPRESVQQVPTFGVEVNGTKNSFEAIISDYIMRRAVFNEDTFGIGILSQIQIGGEAALTRGFQVYQATLKSIRDEFGTTLERIYYNDFAIERGTLDFGNSTKYDVRTRITKGRLKRLLKAAKANPDTTWNVEALQELYDNGPNADGYHTTQSDPRDPNGERAYDNQFDIITCYYTGPYHDIITFSPSIAKPLRVQKSRSKFGYPRLQALVIDPAQLSPFGISRARLASPAANYANIYLQSTAKMQLINADPPVFQRGQFATPVRLRRGALLKSIDPNADIQVKELSNSTLQQFENVLGFVHDQIRSIMGVSGGQFSQRAGSTYVNKTMAQGMQQTSSLASQQITSILENFLRQYALTALDLFISEQIGTSEMIIDDKAKDALNSLAEQRFKPTPEMPIFVPPVGDDNKIEINWEEFYDNIENWTVSIDLSMSKDNLDEKKRADLQDMLTVTSQTADPNDPVAQARKRQLEDKLLAETVPDLELSHSEPMQAEIPQEQLGGVA